MQLTPNSPAASLPLSAPGAADGRALLSRLARGGLAARGIVYGVIGALSLGLAAGAGGRTESQTGALETIGHQPLGSIVLVVLAIGLASYAAWRVLEGVSGFRVGETAGVGRRAAAIGSGIAYAVLCATAVEVVAGSHPSGGGASQTTAGVLGWPGGPVLVGIAGAALLGAGAYQGYKGVSRRFLQDTDVQRMSEEATTVFTTLGIAGYFARGVTFLLTGYGLIKAAVDYSPKSAVGLDGALQELIRAPDGPVLLGIVAAGFIAFALYSIADARYHRV